MRFQSMDFGEGSEFAMGSLGIPADSQPSPVGSVSTKRREAEMKRLKLELKQTMDMYSSACKEAISAKQKARELHQWKMEEARKVEALRQAEEAALALAEVEKAKCKAAIEAAEAAQRIAELEAKKRLERLEQKAIREAEEKKKALDALAQNDVRYRKYSIDEIETATEKFSDNLKIGEGGYGPVYKATLDHTPVAIKVLRPDAAQGRKQFQQECAELRRKDRPDLGSVVLPELNRLRDLGHEYEAQKGSIGFGVSTCSPLGSPSPKSQSQSPSQQHQQAQVLSTQNASAPWAGSSEG
ncbi:hypothetical protein J5N97_025591 [Dioscorea zingiberensis]|uniref:RING-type E3 ubiquitin transferase n=1 Tax=Dioscorea zingiberensis TaxID=325984 RepID=A0A9D5C1X3_9LILI|nr:hypothetical protein J5N97_025591 [Dioscorea zingiberensis]